MYVASLVLGLVSIVSFYFPIGGIIISLVSLGISIPAMIKRSRQGGPGSGMAVAGLVLSIISVSLAMIITFVYITALGNDMLNSGSQYLYK